MTKVICVTGKMAAGKNYICKKMEKDGWISIDADKVAHKAIDLASASIINEFNGEALQRGISIQNSDGTINRKELGRLVFSSPKFLEAQESIVYPVITQMVKDFVKENEGKKIILNATVLYKTPDLLQMCEYIIFVKAGFFKRIFRAKKRDSLSYRQIFLRFKAQRKLFFEYKKTGKEIRIVKN